MTNVTQYFFNVFLKGGGVVLNINILIKRRRAAFEKKIRISFQMYYIEEYGIILQLKCRYFLPNLSILFLYSSLLSTSVLNN